MRTPPTILFPSHTQESEFETIILPQINTYMRDNTGPRNDVHLDLSQVEKLGLFEAVALLITIERLSRSATLRLSIPQNSVLEDLTYMGFFRAIRKFRSDIVLNIPSDAYDDPRTGKYNYGILNLTERTKDILSSPRFWLGILTLFRKHMKSKPTDEDLGFVVDMLKEFIFNALEHSGASSYLMLRYFKENQSFEALVADGGVGISRGLQKNYPHLFQSPVSDIEAIRIPYLQGIIDDSVRIGRGRGLWWAKELAHRVRAKIVTRSGTGKYKISPTGGSEEFSDLEYFWGTQCSITLI